METSDSGTLAAWAIAHAAARAIGTFDGANPGQFALTHSGGLRAVAPDDPAVVLFWSPVTGWESALAEDDPDRDLLDLYLPISSATVERPITIGHLGQSLDGFIATHSGDAISVTGPENILHLLHQLANRRQAIVRVPSLYCPPFDAPENSIPGGTVSATTSPSMACLDSFTTVLA